ncbi:MAG: hypothetical protein M3092_00095 [Actinomycetia bacterium]|nr:hypothetical protein [Actinomycetes bacterium]
MFGFIAIGVLAVALSFVALSNSRLAGRKGWVYNKHNPRPPGAGMPKIFDEVYQPSVEHVIEHEASERTKADRSESGDTGVPD